MVTRINNSLPENAEEEFAEEAEVEATELLKLKNVTEDQSADDSISHYFKDTGRIQLLTVADERRLAALIESGNFLVRLQSAYSKKHGCDASSVDIAYEVLLANQKGLGLIAGATESDNLCCELKEIVDPKLNELVVRISESGKKPAVGVRKTLIDYFTAKRIMPDVLLDLLNEHRLNAAKLPPGDKLKPILASIEEKLDAYFEDVKKNAKKSEEHIVIANLRLVISIARKYVGHGLTLLDLIQEGNTGLMRAVQKYDYRRGYKFSTYATWWIKQSIIRAIAYQRHTIRIPVYMVYLINRYMDSKQRLYQEYKRRPTTEEIARKMDIPVTKAKEIEKALSQQSPVSLELPLDNEEDTGEFGDLVSVEAITPEESMDEEWLQEQVQKSLHDLSPRERRIIEMRFGIGNGGPRTLDEIGTEFHLTRERIRQIEVDALRKLKQPLQQLIAEAN